MSPFIACSLKTQPSNWELTILDLTQTQLGYFPSTVDITVPFLYIISDLV